MARQPKAPPGNRTATYVRISTVNQLNGQGLELQTTDVARYANAKGYEVVAQWSDVESGAKDDRVGFQAMRAAAHRREFDRLLVWDATRFGRNAAAALTAANELEDFGVIVEDTKGRSSADKMTWGILSVVAEYEKDMIKSRMVGGRRMNATQGKVIGGSTPYGYTVDGEKRLMIEPTEAAAVKLIYDLALQPDKYPSSLAIAKELRKRGVKTRGRNWGDRVTTDMFGYSHVQNYVRDPIYRGDGRSVEIAGQEYMIPAPAIVSKAIWNQANRIVDKRSRQFDSSQAPKNPYGLRGRFKHDEDGVLFTMRAEMKPHGTGIAHRQYRCVNSVSPRTGCPGVQVGGPRRTTINADDIEARVILWGLRMMDNPALFTEAIEDHNRSLIAGVDAAVSREALESRLAALDQKADRAKESYIDGDITKEVRDTKLTEVAADRVAVEEAIAGMDRLIDPQDTIEAMMAIEVRYPEPGEVGPDDETWPEVKRWLWNRAIAFGQTGDPLPAGAVQWVSAIAEMLDLSVVVKTRDDIEIHGSTASDTLWKWS